MTCLGIDQSKRSTGCVWLGSQGELRHFLLITPPRELDGVELIRYQWDQLHAALSCNRCQVAVIEGLSFAAVGSGKDLLAGLNWYFRTRLAEDFCVFCGTVPVSMWRSQVLTKEEQRQAKSAGKNGLKHAVANKLPPEVYENFLNYVTDHKGRINEAHNLGQGSMKYVEAVWDLADAYFIAAHRLKLSANK